MKITDARGQMKTSDQRSWQSYFCQSRFYIYEGNDEVGHDESDAYDTKREAIERAKITVQNAKDMGLTHYVAHVIDRKTTEFLFTARI
jgi:hypothetical protein